MTAPAAVSGLVRRLGVGGGDRVVAGEVLDEVV
jgi:hypothetical protein